MMKKYIDYFVPDNMRVNADEYRRAFQLTAFTQLSFLFFIPNFVKWYKMGHANMALSIFCVMVCVSCIAPFVLKFSRSLTIMGNFIFAALFWHFSVLPAVTGGILSSSLAWNIVLPIFVSTFLGFGSFVFWAAFMFFEIIAFLFIHMAGYALPTLSMTPAQMIQAQISNVLGPYLTMVVALVFGNWGLKKALAAQKEAAAASAMAEREQATLRKKSDTLAKRLESIFVEVSRHTENLTENVMENMSALTRESAQNAIAANDMIGQTGDVVSKTNASMKALTLQMTDITRTSEETYKIRFIRLKRTLPHEWP